MDRAQLIMSKLAVMGDGQASARDRRTVELAEHELEWASEQIRKMLAFAKANGRQRDALVYVNRTSHKEEPGSRIFKLKMELLGRGIITEAQGREIETRVPPLLSAREKARQAREQAKLVKAAIQAVLKQVPRQYRDEALALLQHHGTPGHINDGLIVGWCRDLVVREFLPPEWNATRKDCHALQDLFERLQGGEKMLTPWANKMVGTAPEVK